MKNYPILQKITRIKIIFHQFKLGDPLQTPQI